MVSNQPAFIAVSELIEKIWESEDFLHYDDPNNSIALELLLSLKLISSPSCNKYKASEQLLKCQTTRVALTSILSAWYKKRGNVANISELADAMMSVGFKRTGDLLSKTYIDTTNSQSHRYPAPTHTAFPEQMLNHDDYVQACRQGDEEKELFQSSKIQADWKTSFLNYSFAGRKILPRNYSEQNGNVSSITSSNSSKFFLLCLLLPIMISVALHFTLTLSIFSLFSTEVLDQYNDIRVDIVKATNKILFSTIGLPGYSMNSNDSYVISVSSYSEYQKKMHHVPDFVPVNVSIHLNTADDWPNDVPLKNSPQIRRLTLNGSFGIDKIVSILQQAKNIQELHIIDSTNGLCQHIHTQNAKTHLDFDRYPSTILNSLTALYLENFSDSACSHVYNFLSTNTLMKSLHSFHLINSVIDEVNAPLIRRFLKGHASSLRQLNFALTRWNASLFVDDMPEFPQVSEVQIDFLTEATNKSEYNFLGHRFHDIFPNLSTFTAKQGHSSWKHFLRLFEGKSLQHLTTRLLVPHYINRISMNFLRRAGSALKQVDISLQFPNKTWTDTCEIEGLNRERERFEKLEVKANCDILEV